jgi:alanine dehydrogenase
MNDLKNYVGFINPNKKDYPGEIRVFTPNSIQSIAKLFRATIILPKNYGKEMGLNNYVKKIPNVKFVSNDIEVVKKSNIVFSLKYPKEEILDKMKPETILFSMIHFHTMPNRVKYLKKKNIYALSLDGIVDDNNIRLVENLKAVAWNGVDKLFEYLENTKPDFLKKKKINVLIMGSGAVGQKAVDAIIHLGNKERRKKYNIKILPIVAGKDITEDKELLLNLLTQIEILIDATSRRNPAFPIIKNSELSKLNEEAIILDLSADSYAPFNITNGFNRWMVKAIEGIPTGNANQYIFNVNDPNYELFIPKDIPHKIKRTTISHGSWPAIKPYESMVHYENQIIPLIITLVKKDNNIRKAYLSLSNKSENPLERALYRGSLLSVNL